MRSLDLCPFCNGDAVITGFGLGLTGCWAECNHCGAMGPQADTEDEAVAKWNDRAPQPEATSHARDAGGAEDAKPIDWSAWDPLIHGGTPAQGNEPAQQPVSLSASRQAKPPLGGLTCESSARPSITHPDEE